MLKRRPELGSRLGDLPIPLKRRGFGVVNVYGYRYNPRTESRILQKCCSARTAPFLNPLSDLGILISPTLQMNGAIRIGESVIRLDSR